MSEAVHCFICCCVLPYWVTIGISSIMCRMCRVCHVTKVRQHGFQLFLRLFGLAGDYAARELGNNFFGFLCSVSDGVESFDLFVPT